MNLAPLRVVGCERVSSWALELRTNTERISRAMRTLQPGTGTSCIHCRKAAGFTQQHHTVRHFASLPQRIVNTGAFWFWSTVIFTTHASVEDRPAIRGRVRTLYALAAELLLALLLVGRDRVVDTKVISVNYAALRQALELYVYICGSDSFTQIMFQQHTK